MDDAQARRLAENEALAREINERVGEVAGSWYEDTERLEFLCECSTEDCAERVHLRMVEYRDVRASPLWFVMTAQHLNPEVERKVGEVGDGVIAQKIGAGADVAEETA